MKEQPPRMEKNSKLRRSAQRQLPTALVKHRRELQAAIEQSKKRPPREVQRALRRKRADELKKAMAKRREEITAQLGPPPIQITELPPKPQEAAASQTAGDQSDG